MTMILIRTNHDPPTSYMYHWSDLVIAEAEKRNFEVIRIENDGLTRENIYKRIKKHQPKFIFLNGHGGDGMFLNKGTVLIDTTDVIQHKILSQTITYSRSCDCLSGMGKVAVQNGCKAFVGYKKKFWFVRLHEYETRPLKDPIATPLLEASNIIAISLLKGKTVKDAVNDSHEYAVKKILELIYSSDPWATMALQPLVVNDRLLAYEGNPDAKLRE